MNRVSTVKRTWHNLSEVLTCADSIDTTTFSTRPRSIQFLTSTTARGGDVCSRQQEQTAGATSQMRTCVGNVVVEVLMSALAHGHVVLALALKELGGVDAADKEDLVHGDLQEFAEDAANISVRPRAEGRGDKHVGQRERQTACVPQQAASRQRLSSTRTGAEAAPHCPPGPRRQPGVLHRSLLLRLTSALARACLPSPPSSLREPSSGL